MVIVIITVIMSVRCMIMRVRMFVRVRGAFMKVRVRLLFADHELGGGNAGAQDAVGRDATEIHGEAAEGAAQVIEREAEIEERAQDHVARGTGETIEIQRLCQPSTPSVLAKTEILHVREDHVVQHLDPHQDSGRDEPFGQPHVVFARFRIA